MISLGEKKVEWTVSKDQGYVSEWVLILKFMKKREAAAEVVDFSYLEIILNVQLMGNYLIALEVLPGDF